MNDSHDDFIEDMEEDNDDIDDIIHGLDPGKVFAMGEHSGGKAFKIEALALLENESIQPSPDYLDYGDGLLKAMSIVKNITI